MRNTENPRGRCSRLVPLLAAVATFMAGCHAAQTAAPQAQAELDHQTFQEQLLLSTRAINAGDLELARVHLDGAAAVAVNAKQLCKVDGLDQLIVGAAALLAGEPGRARHEWSRIEEPHLSREVRHKARLIGMDLPMEPLDSEMTR